MFLNRCFFILLFLLSIPVIAETKSSTSQHSPVMVADMETEPEYKVYGPREKPEVTFDLRNISQGKRSLRFEFTGKEKDRASLVFPFKKDVGDYNVFGFDFYCESDNGATLGVHVHQQVDNPKKETADSYATMFLKEGRDGWVRVRLIKEQDFLFREKGGYKPDWSKVSWVSFGLGKGMKGKAIFYLDNIRFEKVPDAGKTRNLLYNSSFETTTNPSVPDGWRRDFNIPPFGNEIWGIDETNAFHGEKSLRIGLKNKSVTSWGRYVRLAKNKDYTFSVFLKSDKENCPVVIRLSGMKFSDPKLKRGMRLQVGKKWQRYFLTGTTKSTSAAVTIKLLSPDAVLWIDAAQLEGGTEPTQYVASSQSELKKIESIEPDTVSIAGRGGQSAYLNCSKGELFDFIGTQYDLYTENKSVNVRCFVNADAIRLKNLSVNWKLMQNDKEVIGAKSFTPKSGLNEWSFAMNSLVDGKYLLKAELIENGKPIITGQSVFRKLPQHKCEVRINRWGKFFEYNRNPVFLYGFYDNTVAKGDLKSWENVVRDMQAAHCNVHMAYMGINPNVHKHIGLYLDAAERRRQKIWVHLSGMFAYFIKKYANHKNRYHNDTEAMAALKEVVTKYRDHPALFGWCTIDEPGNRAHIFTKERVKKYYDMVKQLDPYHPCALSHVTHLGESKIYGDAIDCAFIPYLARGGRYDHLFKEFYDIGKPIITNSPCYGAAGGAAREPTPNEQRIRMFKAIILGARGLCSYTYRPASVSTWNEFAKIGKELKQIAPALLTPDDRLQVEITTESKSIYALLKKYKGKFYLIAVNTSLKPFDVQFKLLDVPKLSGVTPLFDSKEGRINSEKKIINIKMDKQSTLIYEINIE